MNTYEKKLYGRRKEDKKLTKTPRIQSKKQSQGKKKTKLSGIGNQN